MRKTLLITTLSILAFGLFGCSDSTESTTKVENTIQAQESTTEQKKNKKVPLKKTFSTPNEKELDSF